MTINRIKQTPYLALIGIVFILIQLAVAPDVNSAVDKITSSTALVLKTPSQPIPEEALLDVGIPVLNDGLYLTDDEDTVFPEVRFAEACLLYTSPSPRDA